MSETRTQSPESSSLGAEASRDPLESGRSPRPLRVLRIVSIAGTGTISSYKKEEEAKRKKKVEATGGNASDYPISYELDDDRFDALIAGLRAQTIHSIELGHVPRLKALFPAERCELVMAYDDTNSSHRLVRRVLDRLIEECEIGATIVHVQLPAKYLFAGTLNELQSALAPVYKIMGEKRRDEKTILNLTSGTGICKSLLPTVGAIAGVEMFYGSTKDPEVVTNISAPKVDLSMDATLAQIDMANWFAQRARSGDAFAEFARAGDADLAPLLELSGNNLEPSPLFETLLTRTLRSKESRSYSFGARVLTEYAAELRSRQDAHQKERDDAKEDPESELVRKRIETAEWHSARLQELVGLWVERRLWSLNLVPEMVLHDDRHVQRVERLAAMLAWPLLFDGTISPRDFFDLCCASWLHDWGHVGAVYGEGEKQRFVAHPLDVRLLHGELSRNLILSNRLQHGLDREEQSRIGLLCAHHQGKSCCGIGVPGVIREDEGSVQSKNQMYDLAVELGKPLPLLEDDVFESSWQRDDGFATSSLPTLDRVELLIGVLRVADGADIGFHRIPHYETTDDYLTHCSQRSLQYALTMVEAIDPSHPSVRALHEWLLNPTDNSSAGVLEGQIAIIDGKVPSAPRDAKDRGAIGRDQTESPARREDDAIKHALKKALAYMDYVDKQKGHYEKHKLVSMVRFEHEESRSDDGRIERCWFARVRSTNPELQQAAEEAVDDDIKRELWVDGVAQPFTTLFEAHGLRYAGATMDLPAPG